MRARTHDAARPDAQRPDARRPDAQRHCAAPPAQPDLAVVCSDTRATCSLTHLLVRGWHLVVMRGEATTEGGLMLRDTLSAILAAGGTKIIIDLARTSAVAPECIRRLAPVDVELRARGGDLRLVVDGVSALHAIRAAGLSGRFEIHRYVGDIVGAVAGLDEGGRGRRRAFTAVPNAV